MNSLTKNLLGGIAFGLTLLTGAVIVDSDASETKHKIIEIKAEKDQDVKIMIGADGRSESVFISMEELNDPDALESKLANLDDETRDTVISALEGLKNMGNEGLTPESMLQGHKGKVVVMHKGEGELVKGFSPHEEHDIDIEIVEGGEHKVIRKQIIMGGHDGVVKGHSAAIASLISKGEFSQAELDEIQAAIDAKR